MNCKISIYLAYGMAIYIFASIFYLLYTMNIGTPFNDSLTIEQKIIKKKSASIRGKVFLSGIIIGIIGCVILRPFKKC
jgi:hypothetical protein